MGKRYRHKKAKPNSLRVSFGRVAGDSSPDVVYSWDGVDKCDSRMLHYRMSVISDRGGRSFLCELIERGYDIRTLDFQISKLDPCDSEGEAVNRFMSQHLSKY